MSYAMNSKNGGGKYLESITPISEDYSGWKTIDEIQKINEKALKWKSFILNLGTLFRDNLRSDSLWAFLLGDKPSIQRKSFWASSRNTREDIL